MRTSEFSFRAALSAGALTCAVAAAAESPPVVASLTSHYQHALTAEKVTYHASGPAADRASTIIFRASPGAAPTVRLDLGNLIVWADSQHLIAVHAANPGVYYEQAVEGGLTAGEFGRLLPPLILPQLGWALASSGPVDGWLELHGIGRVRVAESGAAGPSPQTGLTIAESEGGAHVDSLAVRAAQAGVAFGAMKLTFGAAETATTLEVISEDLAAADVGDVASWSIPLAGRARVERLTDLRPIPGDVGVGDACPALSLITSKIEGWSFADAVQRLAQLNPQPAGPVWVALVVRVPAGGGGGGGVIPAGVVQATRGLDSLVREFSIQRMQGLQSSPRLEAHEAVVLELGEVNPRRVAELSGPVVAGTESMGERLFSTTGVAVFRRVAPGADAAVIVLDERQRIGGVVRLDDRMVDTGTIREEVRRIISTRGESPAPENKQPAPEDGAGKGSGGN